MAQTLSPEFVQQVMDPRPSVADQAVVDAMVRNYAKDVADAYDAYAAGEIPRERMLQHVSDLARQAARPFTGTDPAIATNEWHTSGSLSRFLIDRGMTGAPERAVEGRFVQLAADLANPHVALSRSSVTPEQAERSVNHSCDSCTYDLLGIPDELRPGYLAPPERRRS
jgi:hypothetical protein